MQWRVNILENAVSEAWEQFRKPEKGKHLLLEYVTRGLVRIQLTEK
jgi:hypothetical protein